MTLLSDITKLKDTLKIGKTKNEKILLAVLIFLAIVAAYFYLFLRPLVGDLMAVFPKVSGLVMELNNAKVEIEKGPMLEQARASLVSKIEFYEKKLPDQKEIPKLLEDLSDIANDSGVKILAVKPKENPQQKGPSQEIYQETPIELSAKCGYHQLGRFIQELENAARFMKIGDISIASDPAEIMKHDIRLVIITYTLPREE